MPNRLWIAIDLEKAIGVGRTQLTEPETAANKVDWVHVRQISAAQAELRSTRELASSP